MLCSAAVYYAIHGAGWTDDLALRNFLYLLATMPVAVWLGARLYAPRRAPRRGVARSRLGMPAPAGPHA
jgi:hypothetical protein